MELVYLWVEDYKNIHKQGFNFSPRFYCEYNEKTKELSIDENDDYIPDFFGKNINVTAIVGKNGSGKSSIAEIIATFSFQEFLDERTFLVFFNKKEFLFKQKLTNERIEFKIRNLTKYTYMNKNMRGILSTLYFGNELSTIFNNFNMMGIKEYVGNIDAFKGKTKDLYNQKYIRVYEYNRDKFEIFNNRFHFILNKDKNILKNISDILVFDKYRRELHFYEMISSIASDKNILKLIELKDEDKGNRKTIFKSDGFFNKNDDINLLYKLLIIFRLDEYQNVLANKLNKYTKKEIEKIVKRNAKEFKEITEKIFEKFTDKNFSKKSFIEISKIINKYDKQNQIYTERNIEYILCRYKYTNNEIWIENKLNFIDENPNIENPILKLLDKNNILRIEYINSLNSNYNYFLLSSGERNYIEIFVTYIYQLFINNEISNKKFIFLFDEIELGLHPNWQKRLIKDIIFYAKNYFAYSIQFILTSHSPFLLSDIPKQNIIFLDKDEKGNCKVVDGLKEKKQTFGANIHTLLSDSFFMEDGLMGEFAKSKIDKAIKILNQKYLNENDLKYCEEIISIIGEPIIKNQLEKMLHYKKVDYLAKDTKKEIEFLKYRIDLLSKRL